MSLVNPYKHLRDELRENNIWKFPPQDDGWVRDEVVEILLTSDRELRKEYHVKDFEAGNPNHVMNTDAKLTKTSLLMFSVTSLHLLTNDV